jgi:hypothetical protein
MTDPTISIRVYQSADEDCVMENIADADDRLYAENDYWCRFSDVADLILKMRADAGKPAPTEIVDELKKLRKRH